MNGIEGCAPSFWTTIDETLFPNLTASIKVSKFTFFLSNFADKAPINESPAAVVSTAFTL